MTTWKVETSKMDNSDNRIRRFSYYENALNYYTEQLDSHNIDIYSGAQWPSKDVEMELTAGGIGYDYRIQLLEDKDEE